MILLTSNVGSETLTRCGSSNCVIVGKGLHSDRIIGKRSQVGEVCFSCQCIHVRSCLCEVSTIGQDDLVRGYHSIGVSWGIPGHKGRGIRCGDHEVLWLTRYCVNHKINQLLSFLIW